tara:strand:- start:3297 stop:3806 length:510 start_codon:yes stop_codon:yes gene_type:complete
MDYSMNANDRLQLQKMIQQSGAEDQTELIRETKHSNMIRDQVNIITNLINEKNDMYNNNYEDFEKLVIEETYFLFSRYTDIFNKVIKQEINLDILDKFLDTLKLIEDGKVDQHEASVKVGNYLKELYVDSALKKAEKLDKKNNNKEEVKSEIREISWSEYKNLKKKNFL